MNRSKDPGEMGTDPSAGSSTGMPRWVKVFLIIAIVVILGFVVSLLAGVRHGPGRHSPPGDDADHVPPVEHGP